MLVDEKSDRYALDSEEVQGIDEHRPVDPLPLKEEPGAGRMLLLDESDDLDLTFFLELSRCLMPPGHVGSAADSPRGEEV